MSVIASIISQFDDRGFREAEAAAGKTEKKFGKFAKGVGLAMGGAIAAVGAFGIKYGIEAAKAAEESASVNAKLDQVTKSMGLYGKQTDQVTKRLKDYASQTALAAGLDDEQILATQTKLMTFKELAKTADQAGGQFDRATKAAVDLAATGFGTAEGNAVQLGKALNDPIKGLASLSRAGITFTETEKERIKSLVESNKLGKAQEMVLSAIEKQVGGVAEASATTTQKISAYFGEVLEKVGGYLLPILEKLGDFLITTLFPKLEELGSKLGPVFESVIPKLQKFAQVFMRDILPALKTLWNVIQTQLVPILVSTFKPIWDALVGAFNTVKDAVMANADELKALGAGIAILAGGILKVLGPAIGFIAGTLLKVLGKGLANIISLVGNITRFFIKTLPNAGRTLWESFKELVGRLKTIFAPVINLVTAPFRLAFEGIAKMWNKTIGGLEFKLPSWIPGIGGKGFTVPKLPETIPALANGGIVTKPTLALIGEAGPEAVVPLSRGRGPGNTYNISVSGALDPEAVARQIQRILRESERRAGAY